VYSSSGSTDQERPVTMKIAICVVFVANLLLVALSLKVPLSPTGNALNSSVLCRLSDTAPSSFPLGFSLANDEVLNFVAANGTQQSPNATSEESALVEKRETLKQAMNAYKSQKVKFQAAQTKLMAAMESLLEVPSIDQTVLQTLVQNQKVPSWSGKKGNLVVFYAPWCPHCQTFVLHDGNGNPEKAPLEEVRRLLLSKGVGVARYDVQKNGQQIPVPFMVQAIPTIYFVNPSGKAVPFTGNPADVLKLRNFIEAQSA